MFVAFVVLAPTLGYAQTSTSGTPQVVATVNIYREGVSPHVPPSC